MGGASAAHCVDAASGEFIPHGVDVGLSGFLAVYPAEVPFISAFSTILTSDEAKHLNCPLWLAPVLVLSPSSSIILGRTSKN